MIIIIVGMHRSGTSALAGLLHSNGIHMGDDTDFVLDPDTAPDLVRMAEDENPKGFYENRRFRSLNNLILAENGYLVHRFSPYIPDNIVLSEQTSDIMTQLVSEYEKKHKIWGFKDPRTALTIHLWQAFLYNRKIEYKTIVIQRPARGVVASMQKRGNLGTLKQFQDLAMVYEQHIKAKTSNVTGVVEFKDLIYNTDIVAKFLSEKLEHPITDLSFIDPKLADRNK